MKKILVCCFFAAVSVARALNVAGDFSPTPPYSIAEAVAVSGDLRLVPGNYSAPSWQTAFDVRLLAAGDYIISGVVNVGFDVKGPATGTARLIIVGALRMRALGVVASNVTVEIISPILAPSGAAGSAPLVNISTRATLAAGAALTPGFVVGGSVSRRVLVRAIGPGLAAFGVAGAAATPSLAVFNGAGAQIGANAGWGGSAALVAVFAGVGAFALAPASADAALLLTLAPGNYTARVSGVGEVLAEVYFVD